MDVASFNATGLTLMSAAEYESGVGRYVLTASSVVAPGSINSRIVQVDLSNKDYGQMRGLGVGEYLLVSALAAQDLAGKPNRVVPIADGAAQQRLRLIPDTTAPELRRFDLDLDLGTMVLNFTEPVDKATFNISMLTMQNVEDFTTAGTHESYRFTGATIVSARADDPSILDLDLASYGVDLVQLKLLPNMASSAGSTFLRVERGAVKDYADPANTLVAYPANAALGTSGYGADATPPVLESYDLDLGNGGGELQLRFNEPVLASSVDCTMVTVHSHPVISDGDSLTLSGCTVQAEDSAVIAVDLSNSNLGTLGGGYATRQESMYLTVGAGAADDTASPGNTMAGSDALQAGPVLRSFTANLDAGEVSLIFTEAVDVSTFNASGIALVAAYSAAESSGVRLSTNSTAVYGSSGPSVLTVSVGVKDLEALKLIDTLAVSAESTWLLARGMTVYDTAATPRHLVPITVPLATSGFIKDTTLPKLLSWSLDLNTLAIEFVFSEPIDAAAVAMGGITLQSHADAGAAGAVAHTLVEGSSTVTSPSGKRLVVTLGDEDGYEVKRQTALCVSQATTYLSVAANTFEDLSADANTLPRIEAAAAVQAQRFVADVSAPVLAAFDVDMDGRTVTLHFDEPVDMATFNVTRLTLQAAKITGEGTFRALSADSVVTTANGGVDLVVAFALDDYRLFNGDPNVLTTGTNTFATLDAKLCDDMAGNAVRPIGSGDAQVVASYYLDATRPQLVSFALDMNVGLLTLTFDELVWPASFRAEYIQVQPAQTPAEDGSDAADTVLLTVATTDKYLALNANRSLTLAVPLAAGDLDSIKDSRRLAVDRASTFLSLGELAFADMTANNMDAVLETDAMVATSYVPDTTPPSVKAFSLDMDAGVLLLTFSESVDESSVDLGRLTLQEYASARFGGVVQLTQQHDTWDAITPGTGQMAANLAVQLSPTDLNRVKRAGIARTGGQVWLTVRPAAVQDMVDLAVVEIVHSGIANGAALLGEIAAVDATAPKLERAQMDAAASELHLFFSEAVEIAAANLTRVFVTVAGGAPLDLSAHTPVRAGDGDAELVLVLAGAATGGLGCDPAPKLRNDTALPRLEESPAGLAACDADRLVLLRQWDRASALTVSLEEGAFVDFARPANGIAALAARAETGPECGGCADYQFVETPCAGVHDAVCGNCTACGAGVEYESSACELDFDTRCTACTQCRQGEYDAGGCADGGPADRACLPCTVCDATQYEISECAAGVDTMCGSCHVCDFSAAGQEVGCSGVPEWWRKENCCWDADGNQVTCGLLDFMNLQISTRQSRRHWVFETSQPEVLGYAQGDWTPG